MTLTLFLRSLLVHSVSWISRWNLTKLGQIHLWDWGKKLLDFGDLCLIFKVTLVLWNSNLIEKSLCAHCIKQWLEFYQTCTDTSLGHGKGVIRFWWPWPHFQDHYIIKTLKMSLVRILISWINRWNLTRLAQILHWDGGKMLLDVSDLGLILKVKLALCGGGGGGI